MTDIEVTCRDNLARICRYTIGGKKVSTPNLMPVINPNINLIPVEEMVSKMGTDVLITNSYIIYRTEVLKERALEQGLHKQTELLML